MYLSAAACSTARCSVSFSQEAALRAPSCSACHSTSCALEARKASSAATKASVDDCWVPSALTSNRCAQIVLSSGQLWSDGVKLLCVSGSLLPDLCNVRRVGCLCFKFGLGKILLVGSSKILCCLLHYLGHQRRVATTCVGTPPIVCTVCTFLLPGPALSAS